MIVSYPNKPDAVFLIRLPQKADTKTRKISLFQIAQFRHTWALEQKDNYSPALPFRHDDRVLYWGSDLYRVMVGEAWNMERGQYSFYTWAELAEKFLKIKGRLS